MISAMGLQLSLSGLIFALYLVFDRVANNSIPAGWTSTMVVLLVSSGLILFFLGVIAEYIGVVMGMALGRPLYLIVSDRNRGPHGINKGAPRE
jgi:undecaprenyl-phosphate 4-deoxy-4-formamido-L-arabinose transferase